MSRPLFICPLLLMMSVTALKALPTVQEALDSPGLAWTRLHGAESVTSTNAAETHDGVDSYLTSIVGDGGSSGQRTSVNGPGTLTFWWNVSSEYSFDYFGFWTGTNPPLDTDPENDPQLIIFGTNHVWEQVEYVVPPGRQYFEWVYKKDENDSVGADRGYLDEVFFIPDPPTITNDLPNENMTLSKGTNVSFSIGFIEGGFLSIPNQTKLFWQHGGTNLPGKTDLTLTLTNLQVDQSGDYCAVITNLYGCTTSQVVNLQISQPYPLESALDTTGIAWVTSGDAQWVGLPDPLQSHDGIDVARSGVPDDDYNQFSFYSYLQTTVTGPGTLKFWWKLSGLDGDQFYLSVGGIAKTNVPPDDGSWQETAIFVAAGIKVVKFTYFHSDFINTDDSDGAFLDQFSFTPPTNAPPTFWSSALSPDGFSATILLEMNRGYTMQTSTNLSVWTNLTTFSSSDIFYDYFDPSATNTVGNRFYRIKSP